MTIGLNYLCSIQLVTQCQAKQILYYFIPSKLFPIKINDMVRKYRRNEFNSQFFFHGERLYHSAKRLYLTLENCLHLIWLLSCYKQITILQWDVKQEYIPYQILNTMKIFSLELEPLHSLRAFMNQYSYKNKYLLSAKGI